MLDPLRLSEAFWNWVFRTRLHRKLAGIIVFGLPSYFLQHQLYTDNHGWAWAAEFAGSLALGAAAAFLAYHLLKSVFVAVAGLFSRPIGAMKCWNWSRIAAWSFVTGSATLAYIYAGNGAFDTTVANTVLVISASALVIFGFMYFARKAMYGGFDPMIGTRYAQIEKTR